MRPTTDRRSPRTTAVALFAALALAAVLTAAGEAPDGTPPDSEAPGAEASLPETGLLVFVDPGTGELTDAPSRQQVETLSESLKRSLSRSADGLEPFSLVGGGVGVHLAGRFRTATVARLQADGTWGLVCVDHPQEAAAAVASPAPAQVWEEK